MAETIIGIDKDGHAIYGNPGDQLPAGASPVYPGGGMTIDVPATGPGYGGVPPAWDWGGDPAPFGGGGGGGGGVTTPSNQPATKPTDKTQEPWWKKLLGGGASGLGLMDWANFLLNAYKSQQKGKFQNVPMTPEQKAIFGWAFNRLTNSPDTTKDLYGYSLSRAYASPKFDMAAAMQGKPSYTPPPNLSSAELAKLIGYWSAPPSTNAPPTGGG